MSYRLTKNLTLKNESIAIGASETNTIVSEVHGLSVHDSLNLWAKITFSALKVTNGLTLKLQHLDGTDWNDVGSQAQASVAASKSCADADVTTATNNINIDTHGFVTGDAVVYVSSATNVITGLADNTTYYVVKVDNDNFKLATSKDNALAASVIDLTQPVGGDTHYFSPVVYTIIMNIQNSTDEPQLPLLPQIRFVVSSGASDSGTVSNIIVTRRRYNG